MINMLIQVDPLQVEAVTKLLNESGLVSKIIVEREADQQLKQMTTTDFYKKLNASNKAQMEKRLISQRALMEEVKSW